MSDHENGLHIMNMEAATSSIIDLLPAKIDLATFVPKCEVCTTPIPIRRLTGRDALRTRHTCKAACEKVLREADKLRTSLRKCRNCQHPSTPAERDEFRQWRKSRGDLRQGPGNPERWPQSKGARLKLAAGLRKAIELLAEEAVFKPEVAAFREEIQNLIDGEGASKRTLRTGGETTGVSEGDDNAIER